MAKKRIDPVKQREKRAKIVAIAGIVLFIAVAAYEVPSIMKMMNQKPPPGANATDAGNRTASGAIALPNVSVNTGIDQSTGELADTDVPPQADGAQLVTFSVFDTKNPFTPQVTTPAPGVDVPGAATTTTPDGSPTTTSPTTTTTPTSTTPGAVPGTAVPSTGTTPTTTTTAAPPTVAISVNGVVSHVASQGTFPTATPVFRLVSFTKVSAQIGIVGGSYATGGQTITLQLGHAVTLQNTTDNKMYKLELVATH